MPNSRRQANQQISENIVLAAKIEQQMKSQSQQSQGDPKQDEKEPKGQSTDPKGPSKDYVPQQFNDSQKQRMFDLISGEEQQILQRLQEQKNKKTASKIQ